MFRAFKKTSGSSSASRTARSRRAGQSRTPERRSPARGKPLFLEPLEDRRLMAILADLTGGKLTLSGNASANDLHVAIVGNVYTLTSASDLIQVTDNDAALTAITGNN